MGTINNVSTVYALTSMAVANKSREDATHHITSHHITGLYTNLGERTVDHLILASYKSFQFTKYHQ